MGSVPQALLLFALLIAAGAVACLLLHRLARITQRLRTLNARLREADEHLQKTLPQSQGTPNE